MSKADTLNKMIAITDEPLFEALRWWLEFGVGMEMFTVNGFYEIMSSLTCI